MKVTGKQERLLRRALNEWQQEGTLTADDHQRLAGTLQRVTMDWQRLSLLRLLDGTHLRHYRHRPACFLTAN